MALYGKRDKQKSRKANDLGLKISNGIKKTVHYIYGVSYLVGLHTLKGCSKIGRAVKIRFQPAAKLLGRTAGAALLRPIRSIANESVRFAKGFPIAGARIREAAKNGSVKMLGTVFSLPVRAVRRQPHAFRTVANLVIPVVGVVVLVATVNFWTNQTFALAVEYNGEKIGYIEQEKVFDDAAAMAVNRVNNTDNSYHIDRTPKMTISVASKTSLLSENDMCDKLLSSSGDEIAQVSGLYVDGEFQGAVVSHDELQGLLDDIQNDSVAKGSNDKTKFLQDVEIVDGLYPTQAIVSEAGMKDKLTTSSVVEKHYEVQKGDTVSQIAARHDMSEKQLKAMNAGLDEMIYPGEQLLVQRAQPFLTVEVVKTVTYNEKIPYTTKTVNDTSKYLGYSTVKTNGKDGSRKVTAEVTMIDGVEQSRKILSETVVSQPVTQVKVVGGKKYNANTVYGDGVRTGRFIWPAPACRTVSSGYGYRWGSFHAAVDLTTHGAYGKTIVAADGGRVVAAGYSGSYGYRIIVDHGNGYQTLYAHCSKMSVRVGQKVAQGQVIGYVGTSGYVTGAHLHFEIRVNGRQVNPLTYIR